jgi:hypothetical protein
MYTNPLNSRRIHGLKHPNLLSRRILISLALLGVLLQPGCLFRKHKPPAAPALPAPVRVALLPFNVPPDNSDLRWASMATLALMADMVTAAPDVELIPIWESVPAVLQSLGNSRTVTSDTAELIASRLSARWASHGEILSAVQSAVPARKRAKGATPPTKISFNIRLDFIPAKPSLVPFRYEKPYGADSLQPRFQEAFDQFLRYLIVRPLQPQKLQAIDIAKLREIAASLDTEYGWFTSAKPGSSGKVVEDLAKSDPGLARALFSPTLYPILAK